MELNSVEAIVALVRQGFGVSIVPQLANVQWSRDRALRAGARCRESTCNATSAFWSGASTAGRR